jgi:CheY-like chemotaxis protein
MANETVQTGKNGLNQTSDDIIEKNRKNNETFFLIALFCLIVAVLLISLDLKLIAGILVIAAASLVLTISRKYAQINKQYRNSISELSELNDKKDKVITNFSHKIREPLNNIVIITDMLMESGLQKKQRDLLETFIASTNNMVTTVNELSMQSAENISAEPRRAIRFNLLSTVENTFDLYRLKDQANLDFILNKRELRDTEYYGDPIIIKQIFLDLFNTIENQVSEKAITVTINIRKTSESGSESTIGFRIQTDKRITLINEADTEKSLAARLISSGKGTYDQEFGPNHTIFNFYLPLGNPVSEPKQKAASPKMEELTNKEKVRKELKDLKVLLVEDNLINQKITLLTLSPYVGSIETATNGKEALDKFGTSNYDLVLMDIQMPVMSGLVAAEKIRALEATTSSHVPMIAITANAMIGDKEKCLAVGIDDYISKPFQPSALIEKIKKII